MTDYCLEALRKINGNTYSTMKMPQLQLFMKS